MQDDNEKIKEDNTAINIINETRESGLKILFNTISPDVCSAVYRQIM
jgi:hypothetical protein